MNGDLAFQTPFCEAVNGERLEQIERNGYTVEHDDDHTPAQWSHIVLIYAGKLAVQLEACLAGSFEDDGTDKLLEVKASVVVLGSVCAALSDTLDRKIEIYEAGLPE